MEGKKSFNNTAATERKLNKGRQRREAGSEKGKHLKERQKRGRSQGTIKGDGGLEIMWLPGCGGDPL